MIVCHPQNSLFRVFFRFYITRQKLYKDYFVTNLENRSAIDFLVRFCGNLSLQSTNLTVPRRKRLIFD